MLWGPILAPAREAYHVTEQGYQGVLTKEGLMDAARGPSTQEEITQEFYEEVPAVSPDSAIEEVLVDTMSCDYSLPVVDENGVLQGELERSAVAEVLADNTDNTEDKPSNGSELEQAS